MKKSVHQIVVGASSRDAITNMALTLRNEWRGFCNSEVFSFHIPDSSVALEIKQMRLVPEGTPGDVLVYHSSFGIPELTGWLESRREKLVICYHNITPVDFYIRTDPVFAAGLGWGRIELERLKSRVALVVADSVYNAKDLESMGFENVHVIPAGLNPGRLREINSDAQFLVQINQRFKDGFVLMVSQVIPHKRFDLAIQALHLLRTVHQLDIGLVIAGPHRNADHLRDLSEFADLLDESQIWFTGELTESQLATLYRSAACYLGTSDHEGLAVPPLEAMAEGLATIVRGVGAVPDTVKNASLVLDPSAGVCEVAEAIAAVVLIPALAAHLRTCGYERIREIESENSSTEFTSLLMELMK